MTFPVDPDNSSNDFIPENWEWTSDDPQEFTYELKRRYRRIASNMNNRQLGVYNNSEYLAGQQWFDANTTEVKRGAFRTVVPVTVVTGLNIIPHNIPFPANAAPIPNWTITNLYGALSDSTQPQPADPAVVFATVPNSTSLLEMTRTNIRLTIPATYNNWTGYIVIEYLKN